jgi:putative inorganic carbon (HCO3(-)) transporter
MIARDMAAAVAPVHEAPLARYVRWALALTAASMPLYVVRWHIGPLPTTVLENLILLTVALYAIAVWRRAAPLPGRTPYEIPIGLLLIAGVIGVLVAPDHRGALGIFRAYLVEPVAIYYVATAVLGTAGSLASLVAGWGAGALVFAIVEIATFVEALREHTLQLGHAAAALGINPNAVALYLEPLIGIAAGFALFARGRQRMIGIGAVIVLLAADAATLSRGGLLAMAVLVVIAFITIRSLAFRLVLLAASLLGALTLWRLPFIGLRITYLLVNPMHTLYGRLHIWAATLRMLRDHPVFGAGINAYQSTMAPYRAADTYHVPEPYAHNIVLTTWSEVGLLGLAAFLYMLAALAIRPWRALARSSGLHRALLWGLGTGFVMLAVHGLVDSPYWKNDLSLEFWMLAALEVVALRAVAGAAVQHD